MYYFKKTLLILLINTFSFLALQAQNINQNRMNRDLNIMQNVLKEMFKTSWSGDDQKIQVSSGVLHYGNSNNITGAYLPGYGVILTIPAQTSGFIINTKGNNYNYQFNYGENGNNKVTKKSIINQISEFIRSYSSNIGQLKNTDRITVIYQAENQNSVFISLTDRNDDEKAPPTIYVSVQKSDLDALQNGSLNKKQFHNRLAVSTVDKASNSHHDVKIMAGIFKSMFDDANKKSYQVSGSVNHIYIDDLGALFYINAQYGNNFSGIRVALSDVRKRLAETGKDSVIYSSDNSLNTNPEKLKAEQEKARKAFLNGLKETIVDYGRTLRSVQSNEQIYVSVSPLDLGDDMPKRIDLKIPKSVLEAVDNGDLSREQAIEQISVREY